jgi:probable HAF family extracellular repeat protein
MADAINDSGQVVGEEFFYDGTTFHDSPFLFQGYYAEVAALNNSGHLTGAITEYINGQWQEYQAFLYNGNTVSKLGTLGGATSGATAINDSGQVAGASDISGNSASHAFFYDGTTMHDLGTFGGTHSIAWDINNNGYVVGRCDTANGPSRAFLYDGTTMHDLGTLGGVDWVHSDAFSINDNNQVTGESSTGHAFFYDGTTMHDLGSFGAPIPYSGYSVGLGVNNSGLVVGYSSIPEEINVVHAFLYDDRIGMLDLNDLIPSGSGWVLNVANDINSSGQIVGRGTFGGVSHAFMLTPVSELQVEVNAAVDGDVIVVQPGVYEGPLFFKGKNITLTSVDPADPNIVASTIIQGPGVGSVITFDGTENETCILSGLSISVMAESKNASSQTIRHQ